MFRFVSIISILVLPPIVALAEDASMPSCTVATSLEAGAELKTIHENVLCLHKRLDSIKIAAQSSQQEDSGYVVLAPTPVTIDGGINPCHELDSNNSAMCYDYLLRHFPALITPPLITPPPEPTNGGINPCGQDGPSHMAACYEYLQSFPGLLGLPEVMPRGGINPCGLDDPYNVIVCQDRVLDIFKGFCTADDCAAGFEQWRSDMTPEWKLFLDEKTDHYSLNPKALENLGVEWNLFHPSSAGQRLDMGRFFETVPPRELLSPLQMRPQ